MADEELVLLRLVRDAILSTVRQLDGGNVSEDMTDYLAFRLDQLYGHILRLTASNPNLRDSLEPFASSSGVINTYMAKDSYQRKMLIICNFKCELLVKPKHFKSQYYVE